MGNELRSRHHSTIPHSEYLVKSPVKIPRFEPSRHHLPVILKRFEEKDDKWKVFQSCEVEVFSGDRLSIGNDRQSLLIQFLEKHVQSGEIEIVECFIDHIGGRYPNTEII